MSSYYDSFDEENVENESLDEGRIDLFISKPIKSGLCTIDENILQIQYPLRSFQQVFYRSNLNIPLGP